MNRLLPWAPLNAGVFLIIFGVSSLLFFVGAIKDFLATALPLVFLIFGLWLMIAGLVLPQSNRYGAPRTMVFGWGGLIAGLGAIWLAGATFSGALLGVAFAVLLIVAGVGAVGYSFMRASTKSTSAQAS